MTSGDETEAERFAACLRGLKERSGRSYGQLAQRLHMSTSTLHRYCSGRAVPVEYGPAERMARLCGASPDELVRLHRLWMRADAARGKPVPAADGALPGPDSAVSAGAASGAADGAASGAAPGGAEAGETAAAGGADEPVAAAAGPGGGGEPGRRGDFRSWVWPVAAVVALAVTIGVTAVVARSPKGRPGAEGQVAAAPRNAPGASGGRASPSPSASAGAGESTAGGASPPASREERTGAPAGGPQTAAPDEGTESPLSWTARSHIWQGGCGHHYLIDRAPSQVPAPPVAQDARSWAAALGAVHGGRTIVEATVRAAGGTPVVIEEVNVRVAERREPLARPSFSMSTGCGGALTPAAFTVDLDAARPVARPRDGYDGEDGTHLPATRLPYQVAPGDPLVLRIEARTAEYDCDWFVEVRWSGSGGRGGLLRIDDGGKPFRTSGTEGRPEYRYVEPPGAWRRG